MDKRELQISEEVLSCCSGLVRVYVHFTQWLGVEPYPSSAVVMVFSLYEVDVDAIVDAVAQAFGLFAPEVEMSKVKVLASKGDVLQDLTPGCGGGRVQSNPQMSRIAFLGPGLLPVEDDPRTEG